MLDPPVQLLAGDLILATMSAAYNSVDTLVIGTCGNTDVGETMLQDIDGTQPNGNPGDWYYTTSAAMVRLNFDPNATGPASIASVNELSNQTNFNVYPNPNNGLFNITVSKSDVDQKIEIKNILGQIVYSKFATHSTTNNINLSGLKKGVYSISLSSVNGITPAKKIIIQ